MQGVDEAICAITQEVLASFGCTAAPSSELELSEGLTSSVEIEGASRATIAVRMSASLVCTLAIGLLCEDRDAPTNEDVEDIAGEIAHMIGGNLKSVLPGPNRISIPAPGEGREGRACSESLPVTSGLPSSSSSQMAALPPTLQPLAARTFVFDCEPGHFAVTVTFHDREEKF